MFPKNHRLITHYTGGHTRSIREVGAVQLLLAPPPPLLRGARRTPGVGGAAATSTGHRARSVSPAWADARTRRRLLSAPRAQCCCCCCCCLFVYVCFSPLLLVLGPLVEVIIRCVFSSELDSAESRELSPRRSFSGFSRRVTVVCLARCSRTDACCRSMCANREREREKLAVLTPCVGLFTLAQAVFAAAQDEKYA